MTAQSLAASETASGPLSNPKTKPKTSKTLSQQLGPELQRPYADAGRALRLRPRGSNCKTGGGDDGNSAVALEWSSHWTGGEQAAVGEDTGASSLGF